MIYLEELRLSLIDAKMTYEEMPGADKQRWSDWYADYMVKGGLQIESAELAALLREADVAYRAEPEQSSWLNYISDHLIEKIK